ncbi:MAG: hypothetical protein JSS02_09425 [Planctomycetes bacterium]|nr:hypothetical protein [Planctomycetota bacterium]
MAIRKLIVGMLSLLCLLIAGGTLWFSDWTNPLLSVTTRLGLLLGALWLVLPKEGESVSWDKAFPIVIAIFVVLAFLRRGGGRLMLYVIPAAIVVGLAAAFLRPKPKRRPPRR